MRLLRSVLKVVGALVVLGLVALAIGMRTISDDPAQWHADPVETERTGSPNDYLVGPDGLTKAKADRAFTAETLSPEELLFLFDAVARPSARVEVLAGSVKDRHITYVQRSMVFGFPDYITVRAVKTDVGAALVIWSRSRFGVSDLGANRERIDTWLDQISMPAGG